MKLIRWCIILFMACLGAARAEHAGITLSMENFITGAARNDPFFQVILADELYLAYTRALRMPASDIVLDVAAQYNLRLGQQSGTGPGEYEGDISLTKLFPETGTTLSAGYSAQQYLMSDRLLMRTSFHVQVSQDIARNAFGRGARLLEREIAVSNRLARYQVIEAYEDYLASLVTLYMDWYASWENLRAAGEIVAYNKTLLQTIERKKRYQVAHPEDVDKMRLELASAQEDVVTIRDLYQRNAVRVRASAGIHDEKSIVPAKPRECTHEDREFDKAKALESSRTRLMMKLLERQGIVAADIAKDNLLPSAQLFAGYKGYGTDYTMRDPKHQVYAGISSSINFGWQKESAAVKTASIDLYKTRMSNRSSILTYEADLAELKRKINREKSLIEINDRKTVLIERVLRAERKNYLLGRTSLNDLIMHKNNAAQIRFNAIYHRVLYKQLVVEWKRLTDVLVDKNILRHK